jgi:hypothetical protein
MAAPMKCCSNEHDKDNSAICAAINCHKTRKKYPDKMFFGIPQLGKDGTKHQAIKER